MNLLLDTHALLWVMANDPRVRSQTLAALRSPDNQVYVSAASGWEIAIKVGLGKLRVPADVADWLPAELDYHRFSRLPIQLEHVLAVEHLPPHHRDPFDRLLIAQAQVEAFTLVTRDRQFRAYPVRTMPC